MNVNIHTWPLRYNVENLVWCKSSYVDIRNPLNMDSHDPVVAKVRINTVQPPPLQEAKAITAKRKPNWDKIGLQLYKEKTTIQLRSLLDHGGVMLPRKILVDRLYDILLTSADESGPTPRTDKKRQNKYPWAPHLKPYIKEIKALFHKEKSRGKQKEDPTAIDITNKKKHF